MSGADRTARVGVKLTVDDRASATAERIRRSFQGVKDKVHEAGQGLRHFAAQALSMTVGLEIDRGIRGMAHFATEILGVAMKAQGAQKRIAAMFTAISGVGYGTTRRIARGVYDDLIGIGVGAGVATDQVVEAFEGIYALSSKAGRGIEGALETTTDLARIAQGMGIPMERAAQSVNMMTLGLVRGRDPLQRMLLATGAIARNSKEFKSHMNEAQRAEVINKGLRELAARMPTQLGIGGLIQSLKNIREQIMENVGTPIAEALKAPLLQVTEYFRRNREEIAATAEHWGESIARFVARGVAAAKQVFGWVRAHWEDIVAKVKSIPLYLGGAMAARAVGGGLLSMAGPLAMAAAVRPGAAAAAAPSMAGMLGAPTLANIAGAAGVRAAPALDLGTIGGGGAAAAGTTGVAGAVAALGAVAIVAALAVNAFMKNLGGLRDAVMGTAQSSSSLASSLTGLRTSFSELYTTIGPVVDALSTVVGFWFSQFAHGLQSIATLFSLVASGMSSFARSLASVFGVDLPGGAPMEGATRPGAGGHRMVYRGGRWVPDTSVPGQYAPTGREGGPASQDWGTQVLRRQARERAERREREERGGIHGRGLGGPATIDARGSTFNIKQDFRDEDPDRIASVFTRDIQRAAEARVTARTSTPFGP